MHFIVRVAELFALLEFVDDVRIAGRRDERGEPVEPGHDAVLDLARRHLARPAKDAGTRKPPSSAVPLPPANGVCPPSGQVKFSAPLSVVKTTIVSSSSPLSFRYFITEPTMSSSWAMPASWMLQPFSGVRMRSYFSDRCVTTCMRVGLSHTKERLVVLLGLVDELEREVENFVVDGFHPLRIERAGVFDLLFADLAPARLHGRVVLVGGP